MNTTASGRPVRFFLILMGGWTAIRLASVASGMLGYTTPIPPPLPSATQPLVLAHQSAQPTPEATTDERLAIIRPSRDGTHGPAPRLLAHAIMVPIPQSASGGPRRVPAMAAGLAKTQTFASGDNLTPPGPAPTPIPAPAAAPAIPVAPSGQSRPDRLRGSVWALWRDGSTAPAAAVAVGRLGGSQAGLRIDYDLTPRSSGRAAAYGRVSTGMNRPASPEGALGIAWQPVRTVPISLAAERRIALGNGARDANTLLVVGGFGPAPVVPGVEAEAYAQAGMVGFRRRDPFADGKFSLMAPLARSPIRLGASVSGGAQPRVERLDIGPEFQVRLPLPRVASRLSVEWRERIAGRAAPASGLAVTLGADF